MQSRKVVTVFEVMGSVGGLFTLVVTVIGPAMFFINRNITLMNILREMYFSDEKSF